MLAKLVTGNPNKLVEVKRMLGSDLENVRLDLTEIQSMSLEEIARDKARRAFELVGEPVMVEDVSAEILALGGFPGPFVKFWEQAGGWERVQPLLAATGNDRAIVRSGVVYKSSDREIYVESMVTGRIVPRRGGEGWGFDFYFVPDGGDQTYSEMGPERKNELSHRGQSFAMLRGRLEGLGLL